LGRREFQHKAFLFYIRFFSQNLSPHKNRKVLSLFYKKNDRIKFSAPKEFKRSGHKNKSAQLAGLLLVAGNNSKP